MPKTLTTTLVLLLISPHLACGQTPSWSMLKQNIRTTYPDVRHVSTDSLAAWQASSRPAPLLLDIRAEDEFAVSHLKGARRLDPDTHDFTMLLNLPPDIPIVTYCSVGYRSSAMAQRLTEAGFTNIANLEGSIFAWANEGHPVYRNDRAVRQVHPYNTAWGLLLKKELRAYTAAPER